MSAQRFSGASALAYIFTWRKASPSTQIASAVADANSFYVLTFEGLVGDGPNEYHSLEIKLDKPGLKVRTRTGYYAQPAH